MFNNWYIDNDLKKTNETIKNYCSGTTCCQECNFFRGLKIKRDCDDIMSFAKAEGLTAHANSIKVRFE